MFLRWLLSPEKYDVSALAAAYTADEHHAASYAEDEDREKNPDADFYPDVATGAFRASFMNDALTIAHDSCA